MKLTAPSKLNRIGFTVDDVDVFVDRTAALFGLLWMTPSADAAWTQFKVRFGEHGLQPIQLFEALPFIRQGLYEVAIEVADAATTKAALRSEGLEPILDVHLPGPDTYEYLYGPDFHGIPLMVGTVGDAEKQMALDGPFRGIEEADAPRLGSVALVVPDAEAAARDFERLFGMHFTDAETAGLARRAMAGPHRLRLLEAPEPTFAEHFMPPLASIDLRCEDVEMVKAQLAAVGYPALASRELADGRYYYFGKILDVPVGIYPDSCDLEFLST